MEACNNLLSAEWLETLKNVPEYWKGDISDVEEVVKTVKRGRVTLGAKSAGGRNIYVVEYGEPNNHRRTATYSSALGARNIKYYSDKTAKDTRPCVFLIGCVHGGEFEGTVAILNLIKLLETGKDFAGNENPEIVRWAEKAHLILIPIANPDGRTHFPFKSALKMDYKPFRYYDQGMWKDGTVCEWPEVKKMMPIKDYVSYLGAYFNDDGINLMHDDFFEPMAEETKLLLRTARDNAPDFIINFHGSCGCNPSFCDAGFLPTLYREKVGELEKSIQSACEKEGIPFNTMSTDYLPKRTIKPCPINLTWALHNVCGGISLTHESQQGVINNPPGNDPNEWDVGYEHIYRQHMICIEETLKFTYELCEERKEG